MNFVQEINDVLLKVESDSGSIDDALHEALILTLKCGKLLFIGNGGSSSIASHMAIDWSKNAEQPAACFNDPAALTAIGNDLGFDQSFARQIKWYGHETDVLFAISSSGQSQNIINGAQAARDLGMQIITFTGFEPDNRLRSWGAVNFYVPSHDYGLVECSHLILNHAILNAAIGLKNV